ncbi:C-type lectin domain family 4 member D-like isoform X1 [Strix aluco]|uniref:C-type lectin domain family 4 member D-like isoform X1 n=2 Tax=Strix aluco TaxID=111821 RepID=UPI003DA2420F
MAVEIMNRRGSVSPGTAAPAEERSCSWMKPWVFLVSALAIKTAFVTIYLVALLSRKGDQPTALQQAFTEWRCSSAEPQGKERGWMCCPRGWKLFQKSCYYISGNVMPWAESVQNCTGMGSHLVVINSEAEQLFISEKIQQSSKGLHYFIGLSAEKVGQWQWVDQTPFNVSAAFWRKGEPSNKDDQKCVAIQKASEPPNNWNDLTCEHHYRVCEAAAVTV